MIYSQNHFREVLKLLVIIAAEPELQLKAYGIGNAEEEMAMDLDFHFTQNRQALIESNDIDESQALAVDKVLQFFKDREDDYDNPFWFELESHPDWVSLRAQAMNALALMNKQHLKVEISVSQNTSWFSKNVTTEQIEINLIE